MAIGAVFCYGLVFGSFFNVAGLRIPLKQSCFSPGSTCAHCGCRLTVPDLIPVLSFLFSKGRCRYCHVRLPLLYPSVELLTACLFAYAYTQASSFPSFLFSAFLISLLVIVTVSDLMYMLIPNRVLLVFLALFAGEKVSGAWQEWGEAAASGLLMFGGLLLAAVLSKGGIGGGDIKLYGVIAFAIGLKAAVLSLFMACLFGVLAGGLFMLLRKRTRQDPLPFAPFIAIGTLAAYFHGDAVLHLYVQLLSLDAFFFMSFLAYR